MKLHSITRGMVHALASMSVAHMTYYAFTGNSLAATIEPGEAVRALLLVVIHIAPITAAGFLLSEGRE